MQEPIQLWLESQDTARRAQQHDEYSYGQRRHEVKLEDNFTHGILLGHTDTAIRKNVPLFMPSNGAPGTCRTDRGCYRNELKGHFLRDIQFRSFREQGLCCCSRLRRRLGRTRRVYRVSPPLRRLSYDSSAIDDSSSFAIGAFFQRAIEPSWASCARDLRRWN